jgi:hypothetical protein
MAEDLVRRAPDGDALCRSDHDFSFDEHRVGITGVWRACGMMITIPGAEAFNYRLGRCGKCAPRNRSGERAEEMGFGRPPTF